MPDWVAVNFARAKQFIRTAKVIHSQTQRKLEADGFPQQAREAIDTCVQTWFVGVEELIAAMDMDAATSVEAEALANNIMHACANQALRHNVRSKELEAVFN